MNPLNILIVDDQQINRKLLTALLEAEGHTVREAVNGLEALAVLEQAEPVDLIISDILMPVMDGYRLCGEVRGSARHRDLPFIFYTATYTSPADEELCLQLGANLYLRKPVGVQQLLTAIEQALNTAYRRPEVTLQEQDILKEYSERLIFKLEQKNVELAAASDRMIVQSAALDAAADAIVITDADGSISWVNRAFSALTGHSPKQAVGATPAALGLGVPEEIFTASFWQRNREPAWRGESVMPRHNGSVHHDEVTVTPVLAGDGTITHFIGVMHDITRRKRTEEELREAHSQLREFLDHSPAVLYALTVEGRSIAPRFVSENITQLLGVPREETLSLEWWLDHIHPDDRARAEASMSDALTHGASRTEYRMRHRDGSYRWVDDTRRLVRDAAGRPAEMVGATTDVTERHQAQDELRESERRFQSMLANLGLIAMMLDRDARITYCNDHLLRLAGWTREELLGRNWFETFIGLDDRAEMRQTFSALLADQPEALHHENHFLTRSGKRLLIQWNNTVLRSPTGEVIGTASIGADITERRTLEQQMLRAQRLESLGTLAGGIAHDLNNVLMPILLGVTLLKRTELSEAGRKTIDNIERSVRRGSDLVKQVLLFARGADTSRDAVNLGTLVREVESIVANTFPKNIAFEVAIPDDLRQVTGDATQLTQILVNLCVNASDAMPDGGQIVISAANLTLPQGSVPLNGGTSGPFIVLEVTDTGEGMPREILDRIFDPFFTTKEIGKGTGLGLSTVQGIVANHGGFLRVESVVGEGTTFKVYLPASVGYKAAPAEVEAAEDLPRGHGEVVMVVDDDATVLRMTTQTLETFGYSVIGVEDGAHAIARFSRSHADIALVLTDMAMPVMDGYALVAALKHMDPAVRIIAVTGNTSVAHLARIAKTGVAAVLAKPLTTDELIRAIAKVLSMPGGSTPA